MILIVNPDALSRNALVKALRWADARFQVYAVEAINHECATLLRSKRLGMLICSVHLGDGVAQFLGHLRERHPRAVLLLFANPATLVGADLRALCDGVLSEPVDRYEILKYLKVSKVRRRQPQPLASRGRRRVMPLNLPSTQYINVLVRIAEDPLYFKVPVPEFATLQTLLRQLGKSDVAWYSIVRQDNEVPANTDTVLKDGDRIVVKTFAQSNTLRADEVRGELKRQDSDRELKHAKKDRRAGE